MTRDTVLHITLHLEPGLAEEVERKARATDRSSRGLALHALKKEVGWPAMPREEESPAEAVEPKGSR